METDLVEHAARLLEAEPTRSLRAETLYRRMAFGPDWTMSLGRFLDSLRKRTDRFVVVTPESLLEDAVAWSWEERTDYSQALTDAGDGEPIVTLAIRQPDLLRYPSAPDGVVDNGLLGDIQDALAHMLELSDDGDSGLRAAVACAVEELQAVASMLE